MNSGRRVPAWVVLLGGVVVGVAIIWAANHAGLWWVTALVGGVIGLALRGGRRILAVASLVAVAGWGLDLAVQSLGANLGGAATVVAGIMGFGGRGFVVVLLALIFAWLLGVAGAWAGAALRWAVALVTVRPASDSR